MKSEISGQITLGLGIIILIIIASSTIQIIGGSFTLILLSNSTAVLFCIVLYITAKNKIAKPTDLLNKVTKEIIEGNQNIEININSKNEYENIANAFIYLDEKINLQKQ